MSNYIDRAAKYAGQRSKPRLKVGTNANAKPKEEVTLARWDMGPSVLAVLGDVPEIVRGFRKYLNEAPKDRAVILADPVPGETDKQKEAREGRATAITRR